MALPEAERQPGPWARATLGTAEAARLPRMSPHPDDRAPCGVAWVVLAAVRAYSRGVSRALTTGMLCLRNSNERVPVSFPGIR